MFQLLLKLHLRKGFILIPALFIIQILLESFIKTDSSFIILLLFQTYFYRVLQTNPTPIKLLYVTNFKVGKFLIYTNILYALWFIIWFIVGKIPVYYIFDSNLQHITIQIIDFITLLFAFFTIGNKLNFSDLYSISNKLKQYFAISVAFSIFVTFPKALLVILNIMNCSVLTHVIICLSSIILWYFITKSYNHINNCKYLIQND